MSIEIVVAALTVMVVSLTGVIFVGRVARQFLEMRLPFLVSFSAGVFLVTAGALGLEVFHVVDSWLMGVALIAAGYALAWGLHAILPETHHHHEPGCEHRHGARKLIVGDAIHNVADGIILVTAFSASTELGILAAVSILIHEALQEISEFFVLRQAGYTTVQALAINFAVSSTILIGLALGALALASAALEGLLLGVSAGFFLHVVAHDLLPRPNKPETAANFPKHLAIVLVGAVLMGLINVALGDSHAHGENQAVAEERHEGDHKEGFFDRFFHHHD